MAIANDNTTDFANSINFAALDDKTISRKNFTAEQLTAAGFSKQDITKIVFIVFDVVFGIWFLFGLIFLIAGAATDGDTFVGSLANVLFAAIFLAICLPLTFLAGRGGYRILKFVLDNGWRANFKPIRNFSADALLFQQGHSRILNYWLESREKWLFANYQYTVGSGKESHTYNFDFSQVRLPRKVPHLIINSRKNHFGAPTFGYDVKKIQVEGNFNDFFTIITPPEYERDALQILTPDVLQAFLNFGTKFDFEMLDDKFFVFAGSGTLANSAKLRELLTAISRVLPEISHQVQTYSDAKISQLAVGANGEILSSSAQNVIAPKGMRLKQKRWAVVIPIVFVVFWIILQILSEIWR